MWWVIRQKKYRNIADEKKENCFFNYSWVNLFTFYLTCKIYIIFILIINNNNNSNNINIIKLSKYISFVECILIVKSVTKILRVSV